MQQVLDKPSMFPPGVADVVTMEIVAAGTVIRSTDGSSSEIVVTDQNYAYVGDRLYCTQYVFDFNRQSSDETMH